MPGTTASDLGEPSTTKFNGLGLIRDTLHRKPLHAVPAVWDTLPAALAGKPSISDIAVLNRRDSLIVYLPAVKGAADYRAYIHDTSKVTFSGGQPRGAVIACAGYRQRYGRNVDVINRDGAPTKNRELIQAIEVPGLVNNGNYTIIVEAIASPCPFPGVMAHTNAKIPLSGGGSFIYRGFNEVKALYGNELVNAQGSTVSDFTKTVSTGPNPWDLFLAEPVGQAVSPASTVMPKDPTVIARSAIAITRPAADEALNAPIFDIGPNAVFDDFGTDGILTSFDIESRPTGGSITGGGKFGEWFFWTYSLQKALNADGTCCEPDKNPKGAQVWQRHGRLYNTIADVGQDIFGAMYFASTRTRPQQLDTSKYVHSFFRVDSNATDRRYWHWMMCGADTPAELVNMSTGIPIGRPVATAFWQTRGNANPTSPINGEPLAAHHNKECLNLTQIATNFQWKPENAQASWFDEPHSELWAFINPKGVERGNLNLKAAGYTDHTDPGEYGMKWRLNAVRHPTMPMFEPFDQQAPLTHFDVFVRPDRVVLYINGRQAWCSDMSEKPLTMKYGLIAYGNVLYHSGAEIPGIYNAGKGAQFHYVMNTPYADTRVWDAVGHSEKIDIPSQFSFDPSTCFKPATLVVR